MLKRSRKKPRREGFIGFVQLWWSQLWRYLVTGLLVWIPAIITLWVSWLVVSRLIFGTEHLIERLVVMMHGFSVRLPALGFLAYIHYYRGLGILVALALFLTTGFLTRYIVGRRIISYGEQIVRFVPLFNRVYQAVQQIRDVFVTREGAVFQDVCMIDYPREGMKAIAFVTARDQGLVQQTAGKELIAVFVPTTPNPTSGYLVYLPPSDITILDFTVEEAMKLIVSGGAYLPTKHRGKAADGESDDAPDRSELPPTAPSKRERMAKPHGTNRAARHTGARTKLGRAPRKS
jgi:uncharacterized membrane protein